VYIKSKIQSLQLRLSNVINLRLAWCLAVLTLWVGILVADRLSDDVWFRLLIHNEALGLLQSVERFLLDTVYKVMTCGNIVDETDDLAGGPDL
jgi:hypothetical protein